MADNKTKPTSNSVEDFIASIDNPVRKSDASQLSKIMHGATGATPTMWGPSIIGFGSYHYTYESGREGDSPKVAFSPRKQALVIYGLLNDTSGRGLIDNLGLFTQGKGCVYIKRLSDINIDTLTVMIKNAYSLG